MDLKIILIKHHLKIKISFSRKRLKELLKTDIEFHDSVYFITAATTVNKFYCKI